MAVHNIRMRKKNGADWDILYPLTLASNVTANNGQTVQHELDTIFDKTATVVDNGAMSSIDKAKLDNIEDGANNYIHPNDTNTRHVSDAQMSLWNDKYTKSEVDNKISEITSGLSWKESVDTYEDIETTYLSPKDGWTVNVKDTDITYRYTGSEWIAISANAIPVATQEVDGKMSKTDKKTLDDLTTKVSELKSEIESITGDFDGNLSGILEKVDNVENNISNVKGEIDTLKSNKADINHNHDNLYASKDELDKVKDQVSENRPIIINNDMPIGSMVYRDKDGIIPDGWLECDGRALSTIEYADLFEIIGYKHGGSNDTFNLPNVIGNDFIVNTEEEESVINNTIVGQIAIIKAKEFNVQGENFAKEITIVKDGLSSINSKYDKVSLQLEQNKSELDNKIGELQNIINSQMSNDYNEQVLLPFSPDVQTDIKLELSTKDLVENKVNNLIKNSDFKTGTEGWVTQIGSFTNVEATTFDNKSCVALTKTGKSYGSYKYENTGIQYISGHKYFVSFDLYLESYDSTYSVTDIVCLGLHNLNGKTLKPYTSTTGEWKHIKGVIETPLTYVGKNVVFQFKLGNGNDDNSLNLTAKCYLTNVKIVDLTQEGLHTNQTVNDSYIDNVDKIVNAPTIDLTTEYRCEIKNGDETTLSPIITQNNKDNLYITVKAGDILSINNVSGYELPIVKVFAKSDNNTSSNIVKTRFFGKKFFFDGDSITDNDWLPSYQNKSWANYCAETLGAGEVINVATGGIKLTEMCTRIGNMLEQNLDIIFIAAGTNDWANNIPMGTVDGMDKSTLLGALNYIITTLQSKYPKATIVIMTPIHRNSDRDFSSTTGTMREIAQKYEEVCERNGVYCINMLKCGINPYVPEHNSLYLADGLHPLPEGHKRMANYVVGQVSSI